MQPRHSDGGDETVRAWCQHWSGDGLPDCQPVELARLNAASGGADRFALDLINYRCVIVDRTDQRLDIRQADGAWLLAGQSTSARTQRSTGVAIAESQRG